MLSFRSHKGRVLITDVLPAHRNDVYSSMVVGHIVEPLVSISPADCQALKHRISEMHKQFKLNL